MRNSLRTPLIKYVMRLRDIAAASIFKMTSHFAPDSMYRHIEFWLR